jgi:hypothetical protein
MRAAVAQIRVHPRFQVQLEGQRPSLEFQQYVIGAFWAPRSYELRTENREAEAGGNAGAGDWRGQWPKSALRQWPRSKPTVARSPRLNEKKSS